MSIKTTTKPGDNLRRSRSNTVSAPRRIPVLDNADKNSYVLHQEQLGELIQAKIDQLGYVTDNQREKALSFIQSYVTKKIANLPLPPSRKWIDKCITNAVNVFLLIGFYPKKTSKSRREKELAHIKRQKYYQDAVAKGAPLTEDDWLDKYAPLTPDILYWKYSYLIGQKISAYVRAGRIPADEMNDAFQFAYAYIAERLDKYDPQKGAQSNWITNTMRGAMTDYERKAERDAFRYIKLSERVCSDDPSEEASEEFDIAFSVDDDIEEKLAMKQLLFKAFTTAQSWGMFAGRTINAALMAETMESLEHHNRVKRPKKPCILSDEEITKFREIILEIAGENNLQAILAP